MDSEQLMKPSLQKAQIIKLFDHIRTSFWFVPMLCIIMSLLAVFLTYQTDLAWWKTEHYILSSLYNITSTDANAMLTSIATSVITMTSIAFSMIVVTLTLASSQFGPRLLRTFMQDKRNQWALGGLVSIFCYCLALLRLTSTSETPGFVPGLGLSIALAVAVVAVLILVFLIHHVAVSIQAESVVAHCWHCLTQDIERLFPAARGNDIESNNMLVWDDTLTPIRQFSQSDGYVQLIDYQNLKSILDKYNAGADIGIKPGSYLIKGQYIGQIYWPQNKQKTMPTDLLNSHLVLGKSRTPIQDPEFAIHQLVEIALRALSPSINDPFTAILCINRLGSALSRTATRNFPASCLVGENNKIRIKRKVSDYKGLVEAACNQIRQNSISHASVVIAFIEMLTQVAADLRRVDYQQILVKQADMIVEMACNSQLHANEQHEIKTRQQALHTMVQDNH